MRRVRRRGERPPRGVRGAAASHARERQLMKRALPVAGGELPCDPDSRVDRETCADCGKEAPQTETNYTLISAQFGWRLTRSTDASGGVLVEWRGPGCWGGVKKRRPGALTSNGVAAPAPPPPPPGPSSAPPPSSRAP